MRAFRRRGQTVVARLDSDERAVIARVVADVGLLLGSETFGMECYSIETEGRDSLFSHLRAFEEHLSEPDDPALLRLLPNAAPTDRDVADEFRRLTEPDLRHLKIERLRRMWQDLSTDGPDWSIPRDEAMATAAALTDVRLVLASRLGLVTDDDADALKGEIETAQAALESGNLEVHEGAGEVDRERLWLGALYQALTWLQDSLIACVMDDKHKEDGDDE